MQYVSRFKRISKKKALIAATALAGVLAAGNVDAGGEHTGGQHGGYGGGHHYNNSHFSNAFVYSSFGYPGIGFGLGYGFGFGLGYGFGYPGIGFGYPFGIGFGLGYGFGYPGIGLSYVQPAPIINNIVIPSQGTQAPRRENDNSGFATKEYLKNTIKRHDQRMKRYVDNSINNTMNPITQSLREIKENMATKKDVNNLRVDMMRKMYKLNEQTRQEIKAVEARSREARARMTEKFMRK